MDQVLVILPSLARYFKIVLFVKEFSFESNVAVPVKWKFYTVKYLSQTEVGRLFSTAKNKRNSIFWLTAHHDPLDVIPLF